MIGAVVYEGRGISPFDVRFERRHRNEHGNGLRRVVVTAARGEGESYLLYIVAAHKRIGAVAHVDLARGHVAHLRFAAVRARDIFIVIHQRRMRAAVVNVCEKEILTAVIFHGSGGAAVRNKRVAAVKPAHIVFGRFYDESLLIRRRGIIRVARREAHDICARVHGCGLKRRFAAVLYLPILRFERHSLHAAHYRSRINERLAVVNALVGCIHAYGERFGDYRIYARTRSAVFRIAVESYLVIRRDFFIEHRIDIVFVYIRRHGRVFRRIGRERERLVVTEQSAARAVRVIPRKLRDIRAVIARCVIYVYAHGEFVYRKHAAIGDDVIVGRLARERPGERIRLRRGAARGVLRRGYRYVRQSEDSEVLAIGICAARNA